MQIQCYSEYNSLRNIYFFLTIEIGFLNLKVLVYNMSYIYHYHGAVAYSRGEGEGLSRGTGKLFLDISTYLYYVGIIGPHPPEKNLK